MIHNTNWTTCQECEGQGKHKRKATKKARNNPRPQTTIKVNEHLYLCLTCNGTGLVSTDNPVVAKPQTYPHVAIIGAGIGGVALGVACLHRGIPFTIYERDNSFDERAQGYGLTLQQASNAIAGFGITNLKEGVASTLHVVHTTNGDVIGKWGMRSLQAEIIKKPKRINVHIARQALRLALLEQLGGQGVVLWGHQLIDVKQNTTGDVKLNFTVNGELKTSTANVVVGADGIRSTVRKLIIGEEINPLCYLGCIVILGICKLEDLKNVESYLLDGATVFQTANGNERIYIMPYTKDSVMWQLSFPMTETEAKALSAQGAKALKQEAIKRTQWHTPIPEIIQATQSTYISGYPVYDRELLNLELLKNVGAITLIGDAAHPMSPFKGQGANQALLDALALARSIYKAYKLLPNWKDAGIRNTVLTQFENDMITRCTRKVNDSKTAAELLHSDTILQTVNEPRGRDKHRNL